MSSVVNNDDKTTNHNTTKDDEDAYIHAMEVSLSFILVPVIVASIDLDLFGIISRISSGSGKTCVSASEIASHLDTKNSNAPLVLDQMLRLLASHSLLISSYRTLEDGKVEILYGNGLVSKLFYENEDGDSMTSIFRLMRYQDITKICSRMKEAVLVGGNPDIKTYNMPMFEYLEKKDRAFGNDFDKAMSTNTTIVMKSVLKNYTGFRALKSLVDVGGGVGTGLQMIISKYPSIHGINFDLPRAVEKVSSSNVGVEHVPGDMFVEIPKADAILLKCVLHDWSDEKCLTILRNCYLALPESGKVIVIELVLPTKPETSALAKYVSSLDNVMLYQLGAKERTEAEYKSLASEAGFSNFVIQYCGYGTWVMELYK